MSGRNRGTWIGPVVGMTVRENVGDGPVFEIYGEEGMVAMCVDRIEWAEALSHASGELQLELDPDWNAATADEETREDWDE